VPLIPDVVRVLKCHLSIWRPSAKATDRVFVNRAGKPIEPQRFAKAIREAAEELFPESSPLHDMNPYDLRHTSVTLALSAGIAPAVVAAWHGHSVATMYSKYAGFFGDATRSNIDLLTKELARLTSFSGQQ
jgi:site-specific recombinase XerD